MSSAGLMGKRTNWADDVTGTAQTEERMSQWGEIDGEVVSFNASNQTATIKPLYKPKFNGQPVDMPNLLEVPLRFQRAGDKALTFPVPAGTKVKLRPKMRSSENYLLDGEGSASDARSFSLSDMEAHLDGGESLQDPIQNFDGENVHLRANADGSMGIKMSPDGKVQIAGGEGDLTSLLAQLVDLLKTEPELTHTAEYTVIASKLNAMKF